MTNNNMSAQGGSASGGKKVIIYSTPTCVYCRMAKDFLTDKNIPFTEYDLSKDIAKREEVIKKTGQMAVPVIEVDGETMIGFDEEKLKQLLLFPQA